MFEQPHLQGHVVFLTLIHFCRRLMIEWQHALGARLVLEAYIENILIYVLILIYLILRIFKHFLFLLFFLPVN